MALEDKQKFITIVSEAEVQKNFFSLKDREIKVLMYLTFKAAHVPWMSEGIWLKPGQVVVCLTKLSKVIHIPRTSLHRIIFGQLISKNFLTFLGSYNKSSESVGLKSVKMDTSNGRSNRHLFLVNLRHYKQAQEKVDTSNGHEFYLLTCIQKESFFVLNYFAKLYSDLTKKPFFVIHKVNKKSSLELVEKTKRYYEAGYRPIHLANLVRKFFKAVKEDHFKRNFSPTITFLNKNFHYYVSLKNDENEEGILNAHIDYTLEQVASLMQVELELRSLSKAKTVSNENEDEAERPKPSGSI